MLSFTVSFFEYLVFRRKLPLLIEYFLKQALNSLQVLSLAKHCEEYLIQNEDDRQPHMVDLADIRYSIEQEKLMLEEINNHIQDLIEQRKWKTFFKDRQAFKKYFIYILLLEKEAPALD